MRRVWHGEPNELNSISLHFKSVGLIHRRLIEERRSFPKYCSDSSLPPATMGFVSVINLALGTAVGMSGVFQA